MRRSVGWLRETVVPKISYEIPVAGTILDCAPAGSASAGASALNFYPANS